MPLLDKIKKIVGRRSVEERSQIDPIIYYGFMKERLEGIPDDENDIIEQSARFARSLIPFMNTRKDRHMHRILVSFLENYETWKEFDVSLKTLEDKEYPLFREGVGEWDRSWRVEHLTKVKRQMTDILVDDGKIVLSLVQEPIDHKTVVLNKPYMITQSGSSFYDPSGGRQSDE